MSPEDYREYHRGCGINVLLSAFRYALMVNSDDGLRLLDCNTAWFRLCKMGINKKDYLAWNFI